MSFLEQIDQILGCVAVEQEVSQLIVRHLSGSLLSESRCPELIKRWENAEHERAVGARSSSPKADAIG
jgi:hypothetical protein